MSHYHIYLFKVKTGVYGRVGKSVVHFLSTMSQLTARFKTNVILKPSATDATLFDVTCRARFHTLLYVVGSCCAKFETGQTFSHGQRDATTQNIVEPTMLGVVTSVCTWPKRHYDRLRSYMEKQIETCLLI